MDDYTQDTEDQEAEASYIEAGRDIYA